MKTASAAMIALLTSTGAGQQLVQADLYTFTLVDGTVIRNTSADRDITLSAVTWSCSGPRFRRGRTRSKIGVEVDTLDLNIYAEASDLIVAGVSWLEAFGNGMLDGASCLVERFISDSWTNVAPGKIYQRSGKLGKIESNRAGAKVPILSPLILLNQKVPRNLFQATCLHTLYDTGCALSRAAFTVTGNVAANSSASSINSNLSQASDYFNLGVIAFTTGALTGQRRTIRSFTHTGGVVVPIVPFPSAPVAGTHFTIYPGCNKVYSGDCSSSKFNNQANFKAMPFIPVPEVGL